MNHVVAVRVVQRIRHLSRDLDCLLNAELSLAVEHVAQRLAVDERHHVVEETVCLT